MKRKSRVNRTNSWYRLPIMVGMALVMVFAMLCTNVVKAAGAAPSKQMGKAPAEAAAGKTAQKPGEKAAEKPAGLPAEKPHAGPIINPQADKLLREMGEYLKNAQQYSFQAEITFDDLPPSDKRSSSAPPRTWRYGGQTEPTSSTAASSDASGFGRMESRSPLMTLTIMSMPSRRCRQKSMKRWIES